MGRFAKYLGLGTLKIGDVELTVKPMTGDIIRLQRIGKLAENDETIDQMVNEFTNFVVELVNRAEPLTEEDKQELKLLVELHLNETVTKVGKLLGVITEETEQSFRKGRQH